MLALDEKITKKTQRKITAEEIIADYRLAYRSRQAGIVARMEVMSGKAKFGVSGDGKEIAQLAMAKVFQKGDFRAGYYRDQTLIFALGISSIQEFFAQLFAHADVQAEPATAGRAMNSHFASRSLDASGNWHDLMEMHNSSADVSSIGAQMPRLVGLSYASRLYRELDELKHLTQFSHNGNEVAFGTIGNAACAEGMFWEAVNAIGLLRVPCVVSIWDDAYGISVTNEHQVTKENISELLKGFQREEGTLAGIDTYTVKGWDYPELVETYAKATALARKKHIPAVIHVTEMTQPLGHSSSGSHERYKPKERLQWEKEFDCLKKMREWIIAEGFAMVGELNKMEAEDKENVTASRDKAWNAYMAPLIAERQQVVKLIKKIEAESTHAKQLTKIRENLLRISFPLRKDSMIAIHQVLMTVRNKKTAAIQKMIAWKQQQLAVNKERYGSHLHNQSNAATLKVPEVKPIYTDKSSRVNGFEILNGCFDAALKRDPRIIAFGQDVGKLGDVNQGFKGLQKKYGALRVSDAGIRESTIIGQAIGMAMRGLRPIAEVQYIDYLLYALSIMADDLANLHWRTKGGQCAPVVIRTRGHRLEGIWHSGSPMAGIINFVRGIYVLVPRDMTQAAGFYNTLLQGNDPAFLVEVLNGYRQKERMPENIGKFTIPLGVPDILKKGRDVTIVTYGATCRIVMAAANMLQKVNVDVEVIDVQTLLPFDLHGKIVESLKKTSRIVFVDEDLPGGTTAYMLQEVLEKQGGYYFLDSEPRTLPGKPHRPAYGSDGDYFSKPNVEQVFETVYELMNEADPAGYPIFY